MAFSPDAWIVSATESSQVLAFTLVFFATFVSEDATVFATGALWLQGRLSFPVVFWGNTLGILAGDVGIYWIARLVGRRALTMPYLRRLVSKEDFERGQSFYRRWGAWLLLIVRFLPGTRVAAYVGAGLFHCPFALFFLIVGLTGLAWVAFCLEVIRRVGRVDGVAWLALGLLLAVFVGRWIASGFRRYEWRVRFFRLLRWRHFEFWPAHVFYFPVVFHYTWLALRYGSPLVPSCANPGVETGGLLGESKDQILRSLDAGSPHTLKYRRIDPSQGPGDNVLGRMEAFLLESGLSYPVIVKPDTGQRGSGVRLVRNREELARYASDLAFPVVVQEYCDYENECGVFYFRKPGAAQGEIFSITDKKFPQVRGDGRSTLAHLIVHDERARWMARTFFHRHEAQLDRVLADGETFRLVESGNHCQGTVFFDGQRLATPALREALTRVSSSIPGFFVGRFDLRYESESALARGEGFKIIEINGAGAEATHIYDPNAKLLDAYRALFAQWNLIFEIGATNCRSGCRPMTPREFIARWLAYAKISKRHPTTT